MPESGYAQLDDVAIYWERRGQGGTPLLVAHGGFHTIEPYAGTLDQLSEHRAVYAVELQGHGHTADTGRPFSQEAFGDDLAGVIRALDLGPTDLVGYSLGAGASLRCAIQHPECVRRLTVLSFPYCRDGWFPEVRAAFDQMGRAGFEQMRQSPLYDAYVAVAPDPEAFPGLMDHMGEMMRRPYNWADEVKGLAVPVLLAFADADSVPPAHAAEFYALLGGGLRDAGWDGTVHRAPSRLAIIPNATHYDVFWNPAFQAALAQFVAEP